MKTYEKPPSHCLLKGFFRSLHHRGLDPKVPEPSASSSQYYPVQGPVQGSSLGSGRQGGKPKAKPGRLFSNFELMNSSNILHSPFLDFLPFLTFLASLFSVAFRGYTENSFCFPRPPAPRVPAPPGLAPSVPPQVTPQAPAHSAPGVPKAGGERDRADFMELVF